MRDGEGGALDSRGSCLCDQKTDWAGKYGSKQPCHGYEQEAWAGSEKIRGRRDLAKKAGNVSVAVMGVMGSGAFSAAIPVKPSEKHSWLAPAPSRAVGSRGPSCPILILIPNYQVVQSTFIEGISGDEVKSTSNQSAEPGRTILPGKDKGTADPG